MKLSLQNKVNTFSEKDCSVRNERSLNACFTSENINFNIQFTYIADLSISP